MSKKKSPFAPESDKINSEVPLENIAENIKFVPANPKVFNCPCCGSAISIKAVGHSITAVCTSCESIIDLQNENYQIVKKAKYAIKETLIEIGARGELFGVKWEVIGYVLKSDGSFYQWEEYLLYNPYHGFRFLIQSQGHWNFAQVLQRSVAKLGRAKISFNGRKYLKFLQGSAIVKYVKGEFYWRVRKGDAADVSDYISPPYMLSTESVKREMSVSQSVYIEPSEVQESFKIAEMPLKSGVACNQPRPFKNAFAIYLTAIIAFFVITVIQCSMKDARDYAQVVAKDFLFRGDGKNKDFRIAKFNLPKDSNVEIKTFTNVDNDWAEIGFSVVNEESGKTYDISQAIEYYHGYSGGENWSEGNQYERTIISPLPKGNYDLLISFDSGVFEKGRNLEANISINRDVMQWGNYWISFLLIMAFPIFVFFMRSGFESMRWQESEHAENKESSWEYVDDVFSGILLITDLFSS